MSEHRHHVAAIGPSIEFPKNVGNRGTGGLAEKFECLQNRNGSGLLFRFFQQQGRRRHYWITRGTQVNRKVAARKVICAFPFLAPKTKSVWRVRRDLKRSHKRSGSDHCVGFEATEPKHFRQSIFGLRSKESQA